MSKYAGPSPEGFGDDDGVTPLPPLSTEVSFIGAMKHADGRLFVTVEGVGLPVAIRLDADDIAAILVAADYVKSQLS